MAFQLGRGVIEIGLGGIGALKSGLGSVRSAVSGVVGSINGLGLTAKIAWAGAAAGVGMATHAMLGQMEADDRLDAALRATGNTTGFTSEELKKMAGDLQSVTNTEEEATEAGMAMLTKFKNVRGDTFKRVTELGIDMAAVLGGDATSAIASLGRAMENPVRGMMMLRRQGISLTDDQMKMVKKLQESGDGVKAQGILLDAVAGRFKGAAADMANTVPGKIGAIKIQFGELLETIGGVVLNAVTPFLGKIKELVIATGAWVAANGPLLLKIGALAAGFVGFLAFAPTIIGAFTTIAGVIGSLISPFGLVVAGLASLAVYFVNTRVEGETFVQKIGNLALSLGGVFVTYVVPAWNAFYGYVSELFTTIADCFTPVIEWIVGLCARVWDTVAPYFKVLYDGIVWVFGAIVVAFKKPKLAFDIALVGITVGLLKIVEGFRFYFGVLIPQSIVWFADNFWKIMHDMLMGLSAILVNAWENIKNFFSELWAYISSGGQKKWEFAWTPLLQGFQATVEQMPDMYAIYMDQMGEMDVTKNMKGQLKRLTGEFGKAVAERQDMRNMPQAAAAAANGAAPKGKEFTAGANAAARKTDTTGMSFAGEGKGDKGKVSSTGLADLGKNLAMAGMKVADTEAKAIPKQHLAVAQKQYEVAMMQVERLTRIANRLEGKPDQAPTTA